MTVLSFPRKTLDRRTKRALKALEAEASYIEYREKTGGWYDLETHGVNISNLRVVLRDFCNAKPTERLQLAQRVANDQKFWL